MDFDFDAQEVLPAGRGQRVPKPTERIQPYAEAMARRKANASRRDTNAQLPQQDVNENVGIAPRVATGSPTDSQPYTYIPPTPDAYQQFQALAALFGFPNLTPSMLSQVMPGLIGSAASNPFGTIPSATTTAQGLMPLGLNFGDHAIGATATQMVSNADDDDVAQDQAAYLESERDDASTLLGMSTASMVSSTPADSTTARSIVRRNAGSGVVASGADYHIEPEATVAEVRLSGGDKRDLPTAPSSDGTPKRVKTTKSKPRLEDLEPFRRDIIEEAQMHYAAAIVTLDPYPHSQAEDMMVANAFNESIKHNLSKIELSGRDINEAKILTPNEWTAISARASHIRGSLKTSLRDPVKMIYGFIDINDVIGQAADGTSVLATRDYTQSKNRKLVQVLTNDELGQKNNFVFADPHNRKQPGTLFCSPIFQKALSVAFYNSTKTLSLAKALPHYFNDDGGIPLVTLALISTTVLCCIHEWKNGDKRVNINFTETDYKPHYDRLLIGLQNWKDHTTNKLKTLATLNLQRTLHHNARVAAGLTFDDDNVDPSQRPKVEPSFNNDDFLCDEVAE